MTLDWIFTVTLFCLASAITPGPNNVMLMSSGVNFGVRRSLPHFLGVQLGFLFMVLALGAGVSSLLSLAPWLYDVVQIIGAVYLVYLAWKIGSASPRKIKVGEATPLTFWQAVLFQWVNPKAWTMILSALVVFATGGSKLLDVIALASVFFLTGLPATGLWLVLGVGLKELLANDFRQRVFNITMGLLLLLSVVWAFW